MQSVVGMELAELRTALSAEPAFRAQQIYDAVYRRRVTDFERISTLPKALRERIAHELPIVLPEIERRYDSSDGTRRYLLKLADGKTVETVWMPEGDLGTGPARSTICISSQVGCPVNCGFCLTALMGLERNLTAGEIVGQVLRVAIDQKLEANADRVNIVMMGQGEPLLNLPSAVKATRISRPIPKAWGFRRDGSRCRLQESCPKLPSWRASRFDPSWRFHSMRRARSSVAS